MRYGIIALIVGVVGAYVASVALYASSGGHHHPEIPAGGERSTATLVIEDVQSNYSVLMANLTISPGSALLDPQTQHLNEDLSLRVRSVATPTRRSWTKGMLPGVFPVPLTIAGEIENWPFDHYGSGPVEIELMHGPGNVPERIPVTFVNHLSGWRVSVDGAGPYRVSLHRSLSAAAFGIVICGVLIAIAGLGLFVAVQTVRNRRKFQPPMTTWYAAMLFAVVPLRNALPGSPPFGGWIDVTLVLWVLVVLVISMLLYILCWWRHLRPEVPAPAATAAADPVAAPSTP
ncbi:MULTISPECIES: DUF4436 domain-containing protein [unclassified Mycobacterium]|uniref:DUF4436 domain-containing protein n=1 Tax=unclassified Mycobacterium TaxID=2642494 RepID=UPI00080099C5|nr:MULTISPECIES: DUF4436 domain-containing protein [unclassified Mycobacterium]OBH01433.1 DUF4436 domain-containing protein [Mycobacterium sp. E3247]OBI12955.1 DUF4436 domain-containing protein [Mycobacterium sp. E2497]